VRDTNSVSKECLHCKVSFVPPYRNRQKKFCCVEHSRLWQSQTLTNQNTVSRDGKCRKCAITIDTNFPGKNRGGRSRLCAKCFSNYTSERYLSRKLALIEFLGGKCHDYGQQYHYAAMQFHHTDPNSKEFDWSRLRRQSLATVLNEISKCALLCNNCHAIRHCQSQISDESLRMKNNFLADLRSAHAF